jgi:hypothetical protein
MVSKRIPVSEDTNSNRGEGGLKPPPLQREERKPTSSIASKDAQAGLPKETELTPELLAIRDQIEQMKIPPANQEQGTHHRLTNTRVGKIIPTEEFLKSLLHTKPANEPEDDERELDEYFKTYK